MKISLPIKDFNSQNGLFAKTENVPQQVLETLDSLDDSLDGKIGEIKYGPKDSDNVNFSHMRNFFVTAHVAKNIFEEIEKRGSSFSTEEEKLLSKELYSKATKSIDGVKSVLEWMIGNKVASFFVTKFWEVEGNIKFASEREKLFPSK